MATVPHPPAVQTSKEGGRTSNPNRQRSSGSFLKGYTQRRRRRRAGEGRAGRPRPSGDAPAAPSPPLVHPWQQPRERPGGVARVPLPGTRSRRPARPPATRRGCVSARWGRGPARLSPAGSPRPGADPLGRFLPPDRVDHGRRGAPRSFGDSASERLPPGLGERVRTNSSWEPNSYAGDGEGAGTAPGDEPPDKRRAPGPPRRRRSHRAPPLN